MFIFGDDEDFCKVVFLVLSFCKLGDDCIFLYLLVLILVLGGGRSWILLILLILVLELDLLRLKVGFLYCNGDLL